jgi:putative hydrolase of the HAD superfamily
MRVKALMVDVDGVIIVHPHAKGWSTNLARDLGIAPELLQREFFSKHWDDIIHGRAGIHERLGPVLADIAPHLSSQALTEYWFGEDAHLNRQLLNELALFRQSGLQLHLATVQEHERVKFLWSVLQLSEHFDAIHYSAAVGFAKPDVRYFKAVEDETGFSGPELAFIDDKAINVSAAQACGWRAAVARIDGKPWSQTRVSFSILKANLVQSHP